MRITIALLAASLLIGSIAAPMAHADDANPLYRLVDTAAARLLTAEPVAAFKWVNGGSIEDAGRAQQVLDAVAADASGHGLDPQPVRAAFTDQIHATEGIEYVHFGQWKLDPAAAPSTAPDLSTSRAAIDGYNREMVSEIALQRSSLTNTDCPATLDQARAAVVTDRSLDPLYQQALEFATHSYCTA